MALHLELWQGENPLQGHSSVWESFLFFCEQFSESLVSTKAIKWILVKLTDGNALNLHGDVMCHTKNHLQKNFLLCQECQLLNGKK